MSSNVAAPLLPTHNEIIFSKLVQQLQKSLLCIGIGLVYLKRSCRQHSNNNLAYSQGVWSNYLIFGWKILSKLDWNWLRRGHIKNLKCHSQWDDHPSNPAPIVLYWRLSDFKTRLYKTLPATVPLYDAPHSCSPLLLQSITMMMTFYTFLIVTCNFEFYTGDN